MYLKIKLCHHNWQNNFCKVNTKYILKYQNTVLKYYHVGHIWHEIQADTGPCYFLDNSCNSVPEDGLWLTETCLCVDINGIIYTHQCMKPVLISLCSHACSMPGPAHRIVSL
jgi:hypothetical protein